MDNNNKPWEIGSILKGITKKTILEEAQKERDKAYDIRKIFEQMELDLISSMKRAFYFHQAEQLKEGFSWEQWQLTKLRQIEKYRKSNKKLIEAYNKPIQKAINNELQGNFLKGQSKVSKFIDKIKQLLNINQGPSISLPSDMAEKQTVREYIAKLLNRPIKPPPEESFFEVNDKKLEALQETVTKDLKEASQAVLRKMDDLYRQTIFKTHVYFQNGTVTLNQAVDMATKDFLDKGINCIEYKNGNRVNIASYAEMALRTASHRATLLGEGKKRDEWGVHLVVVSAHANTCKHCEPWQGKVLIDDVFSHGTKEDGPYSLLSEAIEAGLLHPNCRHTLTTFFPGITQLPMVPDGKEAVKTYEAEQKQRALEREIRKWKRVEAGACDLENQEKADARVKELEGRLREHLKNSQQLRRDYNREGAELSVKNKENIINNLETKVNWDIIKSEEYRNKFKGIGNNENVDETVYKLSKRMLQHRDGTEMEDMYLIDSNTGKIVGIQTNSINLRQVDYNKSIKEAIKNSEEGSLIGIHNHPSGMPPSDGDLNSLFRNKAIKKGIIAGHDGSVFEYTAPMKPILIREYDVLSISIKKLGYSEFTTQIKALEKLKEKYKFDFKER